MCCVTGSDRSRIGREHRYNASTYIGSIKGDRVNANDAENLITVGSKGINITIEGCLNFQAVLVDRRSSVSAVFPRTASRTRAASGPRKQRNYGMGRGELKPGSITAVSSARIVNY